MQSMPPAIGLMISAFLFALVHLNNPGIGILPLVNLFAAGLMLGINYIYTQNLWFGIFLHFGWNFLQGPILGYPVSGISVSSIVQQSATGPSFITGGSFGFEGSAIGLVLILAVTFWVSHMYKVRLHKSK
jgi:membrane protease YdiL (CAAX protease family)